jgi:hypothetical protein
MNAATTPGAIERLEQQATTASGLADALEEARRVAQALPEIVRAERLVWGLDSMSLRVTEKPDDRLANAILSSPSATDMAIALLDEVSQHTPTDDNSA